MAVTMYKVKRKKLGTRVLPAVLDKLADFIGTQVEGSLGWFDGITIEPLAAGKKVPKQLATDGVVFAALPDGGRIVVLPGGAVIALAATGTARLVAASSEAFALAWAKSTTGVTALDHDGSKLVARHGKSAATTTSVPSARKALAAYLTKQKVKAPKVTFDLDAYLGTTTATFDGRVPAADKKQVADLAAGKRTAFAAYGAQLTKLGHLLGPVVVAEAAAIGEPSGKRQAKNAAKAAFRAYVTDHLGPRFSKLATNITHWTEPSFPQGLGFRYGFLDELDTFGWSAAMIEQARQLLDDDHARWARDLTPRGMTFDSLDVFATFPALRRLRGGWSKFAGVKSLAPLASLTQLVGLEMRGIAATDLSPLKKLPLVTVDLGGGTFADLSGLAKHPTLEYLDLGNCKNVADITPLLSCPRLCYVNLWDTKVSDADTQRLIDALKKRRVKPSYPDYAITGYDPGVSHRGPSWVT